MADNTSSLVCQVNSGLLKLSLLSMDQDGLSQPRSQARSAVAQETEEIDLRELLLELYQHKWFILAVVFICFLIAFFYASQIPPLYQTSALIQVENKSSVMQEMNFLNDAGGMSNPTASSSDIESALMQSRYILEPTIRAYHLDLIVYPHHFSIPILSGIIAKLSPDRDVLTVDEFDVPQNMEGGAFLLKVLNRQQYQLYFPDGRLLFVGTVGPLEASTLDSRYKIRVSQLKAQPGAEFNIVRQPIFPVQQSFSKTLSITDVSSSGSSASAFSGKTGVLMVTLTGTDSQKIPLILNTILDFEIQRNLAKKSVEIRQVLGFLQQQLPLVQTDLNQAESALNQYRVKTKSLGLSFESQVLLGQLTALEQSLGQLQLRKSELLFSYTENHPLVIAAAIKEKQLESELAALQQKIGTLPKTEQKAVALERDVTVKNNMYMMILSRVQQLQVTQAGITSDVSILNGASYPVQLPSKKQLILLGSILFGFVLAGGIIFIRKLFSHGVTDPDYIEDQLGISIYAIIPHSPAQEKITKEVRRKLPGMKSFILANRNPKDLAIEGLRSLRTTLQFAVAEAKNNIIGITGASPSIGKSFISTNLAFLLADTGKTVLLIDADMRKGRIHEYLSKRHDPGLAEILEEKMSFDAVKQTVSDKIDFIATGKYPHNPSELLMREHIGKFLNEVSARYDIVLVDTPPVLAVTDSTILMQHVGTNLMVVGSGKETLSEISHAIKRTKKNQITIQGLIFNNMVKQKHAYGYYNYYYYDYRSKDKK